ncbi:hypothetical protein [Bradyrhizobium canariense]|uniref:hypothetical protein n=1 Tax=Bradyrhizobium canariense TaxID=255045 RepID=UPI0011BAB25E|nr:hypothetical protein [Bradyrhizobium canariense]
MTLRETTKLTPFAGTDLKRQDENEELRRQNNIFSNRIIRPAVVFMTPPTPECTSGAPEKPGVWPNSDSGVTSFHGFPGISLPISLICNQPGAAYHRRIIVLF